MNTFLFLLADFAGHFDIGLTRIENCFTIYIPICMQSGVARFFSVELTKPGENIPNNNNIYQTAVK
jgi:hypothetical protein